MSEQPEVRELTREEGWQLFDREARRELGMSGAEFLRRYDAGEFDGRTDCDFTSVEFLLPFAGQSPRRAS